MEAQVANRPRTRQRVYKPPPVLQLPDINQDATERKRVLNVLAQRRYRERKRQVRKKAGSTAAPETSCQGADEGVNDESSRHEEVGSDRAALTDSHDENPMTARLSQTPVAAVDDDDITDISVCAVPWDFITNKASDTLMVAESSPSASNSSGLMEVIFDDSSAMSSSSPHSLGTINPLSVFESSLSPLPSSSSSSSSSSSPSSPSAGEDEFSFPDSYLLPVTELTLLRAFLRICTRIGLKSNFWDVNTISPFCDPTSSTSHLPRTWQPTMSQMLVPHHPILDVLPWPSVREKIINIFTLPDNMRPSAARSPTAIVQFAYDLEDNSEGMRIWGNDPYDPTSWEVGQVLFERWWFIFDREIIEQSNMWREMRGAARLEVAKPETRQ